MSKVVQSTHNNKDPQPPPAVRKQTSSLFTNKIPLIRSLILDSVKPGTIKKIYLFGSYAYGKPTKKSDIDLCVIIGDNLIESKTDINLKIAISLFDNKIIPADVLVYTEKQFYNVKNQNSIKNTIITKGSILYE
ncbi:MAG: nucleotidyltransferase domain-containing protein [Treponema sp.]|nr:nucleotidyltransferase domain-containing protein [Treponema sp.]